jgi:hypothetical protein
MGREKLRQFGNRGSYFLLQVWLGELGILEWLGTEDRRGLWQWVGWRNV